MQEERALFLEYKVAAIGLTRCEMCGIVTKCHGPVKMSTRVMYPCTAWHFHLEGLSSAKDLHHKSMKLNHTHALIFLDDTRYNTLALHFLTDFLCCGCLELAIFCLSSLLQEEGGTMRLLLVISKPKISANLILQKKVVASSLPFQWKWNNMLWLIHPFD